MHILFFIDLPRGFSEEDTEVDRVGALPKRHSMDLTMKSVLPDSSDDPSKLSTSAEDIDKKTVENKIETDPVTVEPDRPKRRGLSPFRFFKKKDEKQSATSEGFLDSQIRLKSMESPPGASLRTSATKTGQIAMTDRPSAFRPSTAERGGSPRRLVRMPTEVSPPADGSDYLDSSSLDLVDEFFYGIRIFPGQEPYQVYCGWVTTTYKQFDTTFDANHVRKVIFQGREENSAIDVYVSCIYLYY